MAEHRATQSEHPWRAAVRTFVQTVIPALIGLALIVPLVVQTALDGVGHLIPPEWAAAATGLAVSIAAVAAMVARVMALPAVVDWTKRWVPWLAPTARDDEN